MKKKTIWLVMTSLIVITLLVTSCAPAVTEEKTETETSTTTPTGPETVTFPDESLEAAIRDAPGKPMGEEITAAELAELTQLDADNMGIADLTGIEYCSNLT